MGRQLLPARRPYFYDTEFIDTGTYIDLISIGVVDATGREFYAVSTEFDFGAALDSPFHLSHVIPGLPILTDGHGNFEGWNFRNPAWKTREIIAQELWAFLTLDGTESPAMWAWYDAHDFIAFSQLWGPLQDLPPELPMNGYDLKQEYDRQGATWKPDDLPGAHNALVDARWNLELAYYLGIVDR